MELIDVFDEDNKYLGYSLERNEVHHKNLWHHHVSAWIMNYEGMILLQQRAFTKKKNPGKWAKTGGHVESGENCKEAIRREVYEEIRLEVNDEEIENIEMFKSFNPNEHYYAYGYIFFTDYKEEDFTLQKEAAENELSSVGMLNFSRKNELKGIIKNLENEIENADYKIIEAKRTADYNISNIPLYLEKFKLNETARINEKYKIPEEPVAPAEISQTNNKTQQFTNDIDMIFNSMNIGTKYTISDIVDACPGARGLTDERITALVRSLVRIGKVERTDAHGKVYYCRVQ